MERDGQDIHEENEKGKYDSLPRCERICLDVEALRRDWGRRE
jgi:hypothetical protein